jgi:hypothetical protein
MSALVTVLLALVGAPVFFQLPNVFVSSDLEWLERPDQTAILLFEGDLAQHDVIQGDAWLRGLQAVLGRPRDEILAEAVAAYSEILEQAGGELYWLELAPRRSVLLLEQGANREARQALEAIAWLGAPDLAEAIAWAYALEPLAPEGVDPTAADARAGIEGLGPGWTRDTALRRWSARAGAEPQTDTARARSIARRLRWITAAWLVPSAIGAVVLAAGLLARWRPRPNGSARVPPGWSAADGLAVSLRGVWFYAGGTLLLPLWLGVVSTGLATFAVAAWTRRHLVATRPWAALGLARPQTGSLGSWLGFTLSMLALHEIGVFAIALGFETLGWSSHWSEGVIEELLYGTSARVALLCADVAILVPIFEETIFRGLVYASLRVRLAPLPALATSSAAFALFHLYSVPGLAEVLWSGIVWCIAYERSRSVWPGVAAHAFTNALVAASHVLLYR